MKHPLALLCLPVLFLVLLGVRPVEADKPDKVPQLKVGIIGLDTSHSPGYSTPPTQSPRWRVARWSLLIPREVPTFNPA